MGCTKILRGVSGLCNKGDLLLGGISKIRETLRESAPWEPSRDSVSKRKDGSTPSNALSLRKEETEN